jgi:hypothetical protein
VIVNEKFHQLRSEPKIDADEEMPTVEKKQLENRPMATLRSSYFEE